MDNPQPGSRIQTPEINTDVNLDVNVGCIVLAVLMGLCVLGIAIPIPIGTSTLPSDMQFLIVFYSGAALFVLVCIAIARGMVRRGIFGVLGGILLVLGTIASVVIFFFFACMIAVSRMGPLH